MNDDSEKDVKLTDFDYLMIDPHTQMLKAAIPYMQPSQQRMISTIIKFQELRRTRELFREGELSAMGITSPPDQKFSPIQMLQAMKPYAGPRERDMIEMLENLQIMMQTMQPS